MASRMQKTFLYKSSTKFVDRLANWAVNPWRRYSLLSIIFFIGFFIGSSLGMINGVLALMDPVGAFFTVVLLEAMVRVRRHWPKKAGAKIVIDLVDMSRIGLLYGLLLEGFKLL